MTGSGSAVQAITARDRDAGARGLSLTEMPYPHAGDNDVIGLFDLVTVGGLAQRLVTIRVSADEEGEQR